jgi:hypothetical protein
VFGMHRFVLPLPQPELQRTLNCSRTRPGPYSLTASTDPERFRSRTLHASFKLPQTRTDFHRLLRPAGPSLLLYGRGSERCRILSGTWEAGKIRALNSETVCLVPSACRAPGNRYQSYSRAVRSWCGARSAAGLAVRSRGFDELRREADPPMPSFCYIFARNRWSFSQ